MTDTIKIDFTKEEMAYTYSAIMEEYADGGPSSVLEKVNEALRKQELKEYLYNKVETGRKAGESIRKGIIEGNHVSMCNEMWKEVDKGFYKCGSIIKEFNGNDVFSMMRDPDVKLCFCPFCGGKLK